MAESLEAQIETYLTRLAGLIRRGLELRDALKKDPANESAIEATRAWQEACGVTIHQLSGGSKAHWLAGSFSQAFLKRSVSGEAVDGATPEEIAQRLIEVLEQAVAMLSRKGHAGPILSASPSEAAPRRFEFVHNAELRPVVEQAYKESRCALEEGDYEAAMRTSCGILEAIVTDALEHQGLRALERSGVPAGAISDWPFETRLAVAEKAGLIRGGHARLPEVARRYREGGTGVVSEREARVSGQVLHVVMRDLNPGR
jgi:hypothetical protein